ncbi:PREDICTED: centrosomal protein of 68 kDa [Nanorana parkeri]|uniref:centrosomal protein of 68 kDa n=1 Tax=Nanorana parkeri TaxID=125878 RepID=UPI0008547533|nr:PREDICTED: centrosomal protein of 68 kDa [Nanorana parkeri]
MSDENDDFEPDQVKLRTFKDSSWSYCDISAAQPKGAYNSLHSNFNQSADSEQYSQKPQTLQEQYWACAIPNALPPHPNRDSPNWDPNKEYKELLDYTYPLNPKSFLNKGNEETVTDVFFQDSGVDLGSYNHLCESKFGSFGSSYREDAKLKPGSPSHTNVLKSPHAFSTPIFRRTGYRSLRNPSESSRLTSESDGDLSPYNSKVDLAKESAGSFCLPKYNVFDKLLTADRSTRESLQKPGQFLASTSVLPLQKDLDSDEEYLSLPPSLKELDTLATNLKDLSLRAGQGGTTNCDQANVCKQTFNLPGIDVDRGLLDSLKSRTTDDEFKDLSYVCQLSTCQNHSDSDINRFSSLRDMLDGDSSLVERNRCQSVPKVEENRSLVQRIQKFCCQLDKLIQWLYSVAEVTDKWSTPKPSVESIQLSLSVYLKLKKDVAEQRTLANTILKDGESLVKCMAVNSLVLKDTLALISKQSGELERHTERLYASVLEAMDTITDEGLGNPKQPVSVEMESR